SKWDRLLSVAGVSTNRFGLVTFATMLPQADNYVRLHPQKRDRFGTPVLDIHMRYGPDVSRLVAATHDPLGSILEPAGFRYEIECPIDRLVPGSSAHYAGAARMHSSPKYGVLDGWNRLHDVANVLVVDA